MKQPLQRNASGASIAHNAAAAFAFQAFLAVVGLASTAVLVRTLGAERFGGWSLLGVVLAYGTLLDIGLGTSLVRRAATEHRRGDLRALGSALGATLAATALQGVLGAIAVAAAAHPLGKLLNVPSAWQAEFATALRVMALGVGLSVPGAALAAVPTALQRLDRLVLVEATVTLATSLAQIGGALAGGGLVTLALITAGGRLASLVARAVLVRQLLPGLRVRIDLRYPFWSDLGRFGALKAVQQIASQLILHLDRFLVAVLVSVPAVAFYTVALELAQKLLVVQGNVSTAFYPAACAAAERDRSRLPALYERTSRVVALGTFPLAGLLVIFAEPVLRAWVGPEFAERSAGLLRVLAVAYAGMALTAIPSTTADALNRPEIPAYYAAAGLGVNVAAALLFIPRFGIMGAGLAVAANVLLQAPWFVRAVTRDVVGVSPASYAARAIAEPLLPAALCSAVAALAAAAGLTDGPGGVVIASGAALGTFLVSIRLFRVFSAGEREAMGGLPGGRVLRWIVGE